MTLEEKVELFQEQITCGKNVYTWHYDADRQLLKSNCPYENTLAMTFSVFGCKEQMYEYARTNSRPLMLSAPIGLIWVACFEKKDGVLRRAVLLGPVFTTMAPFPVSSRWFTS